MSQLCLRYLVCHSPQFVIWEQRKEFVVDLKAIYASTTVEVGKQRLAGFEEKWNQTLAPIGQSWRKNWERIISFFNYLLEIRKIIYTISTIESINMSLRVTAPLPSSSIWPYKTSAGNELCQFGIGKLPSQDSASSSKTG